MKKNSAILFFVSTLCFFVLPIAVFAEDSASSTKINARILPTVWYSTLSVNDGDSIKIYAGIQNNSGIDFVGTTTFFVDDEEISNAPFSSSADSLKDVSVNWVADPGSRDIKVKISSADLPSGKTLVSYESDKSIISITRNVTPEAVQAVAVNTANTIVEKTDQLASALADKIESLKKPSISNDSDGKIDGGEDFATNTSEIKKGTVLGTSTKQSVVPKESGGSVKMDSVFNTCMDILALMVRGWKWTLGGIVLLFLILKITGWRKKK
jgi:hypothetical protein